MAKAREGHIIVSDSSAKVQYPLHGPVYQPAGSGKAAEKVYGIPVSKVCYLKKQQRV